MTRPYQEVRLGPGKGLLPPRISQGPCAVALMCCERARCSLGGKGCVHPQPTAYLKP